MEKQKWRSPRLTLGWATGIELFTNLPFLQILSLMFAQATYDSQNIMAPSWGSPKLDQHGQVQTSLSSAQPLLS
jgi:hypothetical protein